MCLTWGMRGEVVIIRERRNYVSFDVIRRIMEDYFGYEVKVGE